MSGQRQDALAPRPQVSTVEVADLFCPHQTHVAGDLVLQEFDHAFDTGLPGGGQRIKVSPADAHRLGAHGQRLDDMGAALDA